MTPTAAHEATTAHLGAAYPFVSCSGLGTSGVYIGRDLLGGAFVFDPFDLYRRGLVTNANMVVLGQVGRGKSAFVKSFLLRQAVFGRQAWVVDPKGEYGRLAAQWECEPVRIRPGGGIVLNPLECPDRSADHKEAGRRRLELLVVLAGASLGRPLLPAEHAAVELALAEASRRSGGRPVVPDVVGALLSPDSYAAASINLSREELASMGRDVAFELRRLVEGDLRGMFDGQTSPGIDLNAPLVVLDLSAVYDSPALGILMTCATAWLTAALRSRPSSGARSDRSGRVYPVQRFVVIDEAWAVLSNVAVARWLQASFKLSRAFGTSNIAVLHRLSDLSAAGSRGSEQVNLARGLLSDSETRVVYAQAPGEVDACRDLLGLTSTEASLLPHLRRSVAVWKVGSRSFLVEHRLGAHERRMVDTDEQMAERRDSKEGADYSTCEDRQDGCHQERTCHGNDGRR